MAAYQEKRDHKKNGLGRRDYDKAPCPFYDVDEHKCKEVEGLKERIKTKMPWSVFALFVSSAIVIGGIFLSHFNNNQAKTLDYVIDLKEKTSRIESKQELIMHHIKSEEKEAT